MWLFHELRRLLLTRLDYSNLISEIQSAATEHRTAAYVALAAVCILWGTTYLGIRISLETIPPLYLIATRYTISGAILLLGARIAGARIPSGRELAATSALRNHRHRYREWISGDCRDLGSERPRCAVLHDLPVLDGRDRRFAPAWTKTSGLDLTRTAGGSYRRLVSGDSGGAA